MQHRLDLLRRRSIAAISGVMLALAHGRALAQSAEAEALFSDADKLMTQGKLAEACDAFEASNRIETRAGTLLRLGECREKNQQLASAWSAYKDALTRAKDPKKQKFASAKVLAIEPRLSYLTVSVSDESRVEGLALARNGKALDVALWNRAVPVDGGDYLVAGRAPGHEEWQTTAKVPVEGGKISVEVPKFKELAKLVPSPTPTQGTTKEAPPAPLPPPSAFSTRRKLAIGVAGASTVVIVVGAVLGSSSKSKQDDAFALCPDPMVTCAKANEANALISSAHGRALGANVMFAVGAIGLVGAGVLWFTGGESAEVQRHASFVPSVTPHEAGLALVGRF